MKESELKMDRRNCPIQKSELKTKKLDGSMKESELKRDRRNCPIQKSELCINRFYRPIQSEDRIGIGRSINRTFRPPLSLGLFYCLIHSGSPHLIVYKPPARKAPLSTCMLSTHATFPRMHVTSYMTLQ